MSSSVTNWEGSPPANIVPSSVQWPPIKSTSLNLLCVMRREGRSGRNPFGPSTLGAKAPTGLLLEALTISPELREYVICTSVELIGDAQRTHQQRLSSGSPSPSRQKASSLRMALHYLALNDQGPGLKGLWTTEELTEVILYVARSKYRTITDGLSDCPFERYRFGTCEVLFRVTIILVHI